MSFNADYIDWFDLSTEYENLIRIREHDDRSTEPGSTAPYFEGAMRAASITNPYAREFGTTIFVYTGAKIDIREMIKKGIAEKKGKQRSGHLSPE